jgi:hypothetical protein
VDPITGTCVNCLVSDCSVCSADYTVCTQCSSNGLTLARQCATCSTGVANCYFCGFNYTQCYNCIGGYGLANNDTCIPCVIAGCVTCYYNAYYCDNCGSGYYALGMSCVTVATTYPSCPTGQAYDYQTGSCSNCTIPHCLTCNSTNVYKCQVCENGYGPK